jgi:hypothetical protein
MEDRLGSRIPPPEAGAAGIETTKIPPIPPCRLTKSTHPPRAYYAFVKKRQRPITIASGDKLSARHVLGDLFHLAGRVSLVTQANEGCVPIIWSPTQRAVAEAVLSFGEWKTETVYRSRPLISTLAGKTGLSSRAIKDALLGRGPKKRGLRVGGILKATGSPFWLLDHEKGYDESTGVRQASKYFLSLHRMAELESWLYALAGTHTFGDGYWHPQSAPRALGLVHHVHLYKGVPIVGSPDQTDLPAVAGMELGKDHDGRIDEVDLIQSQHFVAVEHPSEHATSSPRCAAPPPPPYAHIFESEDKQWARLRKQAEEFKEQFRAEIEAQRAERAERPMPEPVPSPLCACGAEPEPLFDPQCARCYYRALSNPPQIAQETPGDTPQPQTTIDPSETHEPLRDGVNPDIADEDLDRILLRFGFEVAGLPRAEKMAALRAHVALSNPVLGEPQDVDERPAIMAEAGMTWGQASIVVGAEVMVDQAAAVA